MKTNTVTIPPVKAKVTLTIELDESEIEQLAGYDDWLWHNCIQKVDTHPTALDDLYWAIRDAWLNEVSP